MMSKSFEEFFSELNSMNIQDINPALEEASKNLKKCTAPFEVRDIVEQQQAEIERLKIENQSLRAAANSYKIHYNEARSEAVKEFAERLKEKCHNYYPSIDSYCVSRKAVEIRDIDDLVKEMVGDTE